MGKKEKAIDRQKYYRLYSGEATPCIHGLPKIHKEGAPLRLIVSSINSTTYNIAKRMDHGFAGVTYCGLPLHGGGEELSSELLQRNNS